jgi:hypothetical protein
MFLVEYTIDDRIYQVLLAVTEHRPSRQHWWKRWFALVDLNGSPNLELVPLFGRRNSAEEAFHSRMDLFDIIYLLAATSNR